MMQTRLLLAMVFLVLVVGASRAHADSYLTLNGGALMPVGDSDWEDVIDPSANFAVRAGGSTRTGRGARVGVEFGLELAPLATDFGGGLIDVEMSRYRFLVSARYEALLSRGLLLSLRGGLGVSHVRITVSALGASESDSDNGLALDFAAGLWVPTSRRVLLGLELGVPFGFHSDNDNGDGSSLDYRMTEIAVSAGVRISL